MRACKFTPFNLICLKCPGIEIEVVLNEKCYPDQSCHQPGESHGACTGSGQGAFVKDLWRAAVIPGTRKVCSIIYFSFLVWGLLIVFSILPFLSWMVGT